MRIFPLRNMLMTNVLMKSVAVGLAALIWGAAPVVAAEVGPAGATVSTPLQSLLFDESRKAQPLSVRHAYFRCDRCRARCYRGWRYRCGSRYYCRRGFVRCMRYCWRRYCRRGL